MQPYIRNRYTPHTYYLTRRQEDREAWDEMIRDLTSHPLPSANVVTRRFSTRALPSMSTTATQE